MKFAFVDEGRGGEYRYHPACLGFTVEEDEQDEPYAPWADGPA